MRNRWIGGFALAAALLLGACAPPNQGAGASSAPAQTSPPAMTAEPMESDAPSESAAPMESTEASEEADPTPYTYDY